MSTMLKTGTTSPLPSFRIEGFRAFKNLRIPTLGRVNLVVGKNNVGKTSLLESLKVYAAGLGAAGELRELLLQREEVTRANERVDLQRLFYEHGEPESRFLMQMGPLSGELHQLRIELAWARVAMDTEGVRSRVLVSGEEASAEDVEQSLVIDLGRPPRRILPLSWLDRSSLRRLTQDADAVQTCHYVPARGMDESEVGRLWDTIALTTQEDEVLRVLRIIAPEVERVSLVGAVGDRRRRVPIVLRAGGQAPEPLRSMGDGMNRIFELALGLVSSRGGPFLIDEFENGVHYSALHDLWRFVFEAATRMGVQVFATTHSWDCIEAFQRAASEHSENGVLIRLSREGGEVHATTFNERELEILTRESIEVR